MEENDPTGYKSSAAQAVKEELGITVMSLPPRSPDLNVLDYALWNAMNRRLRAQESKFHPTKKETTEQSAARIRRAALSLPESLVRKAVGSMRRRLQLIKENKGGLINE